MSEERPKIYDDQIPPDTVIAVSAEQARAIRPRYIHERLPKLRWWRRMLGRRGG